MQQYTSHTLPWPTDWAALLGVERPLIVEIGFGNADYLIALAQNYPDYNVIGFEVSSQSIDKARKKIARLQLKNTLVVYSRGETALHHLLRPNSVRQIHINYPDPWFKARHARRRIMQRDTLDAIVSRLQPDSLFYLATDIEDYALMSHELLAETPALTNLLDMPYVHQFPERLITTKYEAKGYAEGRRGHFFKYQRNHYPITDIPVKEEWPVPHVILTTPMAPQDIAAAVQREAFHDGEIHIALFNGFWNPSHDSVLFEVNIDEATIEQHIALILRSREAKDEYTLKYATFGMPRPTEGMHIATAAIARWIVSLHPDAQIVSDRTRAR